MAKYGAGFTLTILQPDTRKWFGLFRNPFSDTAVQSTDDVFSSRDIRYVRETMFQTATYGGMLAVYGESGSGKSTLRRDLIERLHHEAPGTLVIEPYVLAMEDNDHAGKTLKSASIAEAILRTIAPKERARLSPDARFAQIHQALRGSAESGGSHVLIIEEAHSLPVPTLKHLKRFLELDFGHKRLLSIILVGQQELREKLSERNPSVREVVQRCELVQLPPLDNDLEAFLAFKFSRAGKPAGEVIDESGIQAIRGRLTYRYGTKDSISLLYPLAVGNLVTAAMNEAAGLGVPVINADIVNSVGKQQ